MSLEKAIYHGKEHRKPYYDSRRFVWSCRNHGGCDYCKRRRLYNSLRKEYYAEQEIKEYTEGYAN